MLIPRILFPSRPLRLLLDVVVVAPPVLANVCNCGRRNFVIRVSARFDPTI